MLSERERERNEVSANLKDSNLQMLAVFSEMFAHSRHESPVCGLPLHCPKITYYRTNITLCNILPVLSNILLLY